MQLSEGQMLLLEPMYLQKVGNSMQPMPLPELEQTVPGPSVSILGRAVLLVESLNQISLVSRNESALERIERHEQNPTKNLLPEQLWPIRDNPAYREELETNVRKRKIEAQHSFKAAYLGSLAVDNHVTEQWISFQERYNGPDNAVARNKFRQRLNRTIRRLRKQQAADELS